jgi:palmitoyltransferase
VTVIVLAGFFGFFAFGMTATSARYIFLNITNIDALRKAQQQHLAIRVPLDSPSTKSYWTVTYPLGSSSGAPPDRHGTTIHLQEGRSISQSGPDSPSSATAARDAAARRTFAIVKTDFGENPFDLGPWQNFKSVMGNSPIEWFLPIRHSPCCNHDSIHSDYEFGPLVNELRKRYELPRCDEDTEVNQR